MYEMNIQVRYSEVNQFGIVRLHQILEYFQDCGTFQSVELGFGVGGADEKDKAWYLLAWDVSIERYPHMCENLTIITEPYKMRGYYGYRRYRIIDEEGMIIAEADSIWILMNTSKMIPEKISDDIKNKYITSDTVDETIRVKRKLSDKGEWEEIETIYISKLFLDSNLHVNNAFYVLWAEELMTEGDAVRKLKVDYRQSAYRGDTIHVFMSKEKEKRRIKYVNQEDKLIALIEMIS